MNILWDFDGTLFDTYPAYTEIFMSVLGDTHKPEAVLAQMKISITHAVAHFQLGDSQIREMKRRNALLRPEQLVPFEGVEQVLQAAGTNVIMTHKPRAEVQEILRHYGWERYFADMVAGDDGFPRKPDPASYIHLHERHPVDLIVGDREIDILPGRALGVKTCLFQNDAQGADYYLTHYKDFFQVIDNFAAER